MTLLRLLLVLSILGTFALSGALLVAGSGLIPITASAGHFAITEWFLQFSKQRSVATHTLGHSLPDLSDPALTLKGAGHYETACRPCHGSPEHKQPVIAHAMLPPPPYLPDKIAGWQPEELFYIVKHGIKFTGMPAWPAQQRDDEIQAMVAFLLEYPRLDAAAYRKLVHGDAPATDQTSPLSELARTEPSSTSLSASCARCHGNDGHGRGLAAFPKLAGQRTEYLFNALRAYASGRRSSALMQPIAAGLSQADMRQLADHYARLPSSGRDAHVLTAAAAREHEAAPHTQDAIERGREIAARGVPEQGVPACSACHGPKPTRRNPAYPLLAGQYREYLTLQLQLLAGKRGGSSYVHVMHKAATRLSAEQMQQVASYYASLPAMAHE